MSTKRRLAIVGAGPMGLEAALLGVERGFEVSVLEAGRIGHGVERWGPVRCFSPFAMNSSARLRTVLGAAAPADDALLTGLEIVAQVLRPIAASTPLAGRVQEGTRVVAIGRARMSRGELAGHPVRGERPFRLLVEREEGEALLEADLVLDASGVTGQSVPFGAGLYAKGERALVGHPAVMRDLGALHQALGEGRLRGRRVLLVGHGHSAAHAIDLLDELARSAAGTALVWALRSPNARPIAEVADDPLPERARVATRANQLCAAPPPHLVVERRASIESVTPSAGRYEVALSNGRAQVVDAIVALTGFRPDLSLLSELAVEISPVTEGAGRLHRALAGVTDCLKVPEVAPADLASGEAGFGLVGAKSYGRASSFLMQAGLRQLETLFTILDPKGRG